MLWFFNYGVMNSKIADPYPFLGLLFRKLGLSIGSEPRTEDEKERFDTFDSIYVFMPTKG